MEDSTRFRCVLCMISFKRKSLLLNHIKAIHGILQPYQCIACLKRYSSYKTLSNHRRSVCKGEESNTETGTYTLASCIREYHPTPILGDRFVCLRQDDAVVVTHAETMVGHVPRNLSSIFSEFLDNGMITARLAGVEIDCGYGP